MDDQYDLFTINHEHLRRVSSYLGEPIMAWLRERIGVDFHMDDLRCHLASLGLTFAPASPDRIMRELRLSGRLDYAVVNRGQSLYRCLFVGD